MAGETPAQLSALEAAKRIREGILTSHELVESCLERIRALDPKVEAWTFLDEQHALAQARAADDLKAHGKPIGALHGVPVGIKDIIDTADMPTENGIALHKGRTPRKDAAVVGTVGAAGGAGLEGTWRGSACRAHQAP
jgi:Asp-tRNA(Asn)/Glu-tRNA(Gln) amidotransferase A subunit family amidase